MSASDSDDGGGFSIPNPDVVATFSSNPRTFVIGAVLTTIVESLFGVISTALDIVLLILAGSEPTRFNAPGETLGIADIPVAVVDSLTGAGSIVGDGIISAVAGLNGIIFDAAGAAGPLSPILVAGLVIAEIVVAIVLIQRVVYVVADLVQLGGLTE